MEKLMRVARQNGARFGLAGYTVIYRDPITKVEKTGEIIHTWKTSVWIRLGGKEKQWLEKEHVLAIIC
jgi:hypothetical protein